MSEEKAPLVAKRATIPFTVNATIDLDWLVKQTGLKQVDLVNRAVQIYAFIEQAKAEGKFLMFGEEVPEKGGASPLAKILFGRDGDETRIAVERINII